VADGSVFLQYNDREHNIKMIILIIFADVNIVVKKSNIIATDYEKWIIRQEVHIKLEIKNTVDQYNEQRNRHCKTLEEIIKDIVEDTLQSIVTDMDELVDDVRSGNYSLNEIAERIEEMRRNII